jgi:membrane-bound metal-dependent hydrolase YbcI (DUF457 family)
MATPLGHYLLGLSITQASARDSTEANRGLWLALIACVPDLDIIPGLWVGKLNQFHHGVTHSFAAALMFSVCAWLWFRPRVGRVALRLAFLMFCLYSSHVILDYFTLDTGVPYGVPLFWPLSHETYQSPWLLLPNVQHTRAPVFSLHNILLMVQEAALFLPLVGLIRAVKHSRTAWPIPRVWLYGCWFILALWASVFALYEG